MRGALLASACTSRLWAAATGSWSRLASRGPSSLSSLGSGYTSSTLSRTTQTCTSPRSSTSSRTTWTTWSSTSARRSTPAPVNFSRRRSWCLGALGSVLTTATSYCIWTHWPNSGWQPACATRWSTSSKGSTNSSPTTSSAFSMRMSLSS
uniref:Secreted protein n=1 Tax=Ixodes ricinus TaxID=34613 RepID=A0A6B0UWP3_IXORI